MSTIIEKYNELCRIPSDIHEHLPTLQKYASECMHITEAGVRGIVSSYAFASGLLGKSGTQFVQIDVKADPTIDSFVELCNSNGILTVFYEDNDLTCPIEQTDLFFIDTFHVYSQMKRELDRWHSYTNKYIIMHDTTSDEWVGESVRCGHTLEIISKEFNLPNDETIKMGVWPAIQEFLNTHPEWILHERFTNNNGLTILKRVSK
jgi:hypothetical protein